MSERRKFSFAELTFDKAFKLMSVELCLSGKSTSEVAGELGMRPQLVSRWKREYEQRKEGSFSGHGKPASSAEQAQIAGLKKQFREAEIERDILDPMLIGWQSSSVRLLVQKGSQHLLQERWQIFQFMKKYHSIFAIEKMCKVFKVSKSGYYHWLNRKLSTRQVNEQQALKLIKEIHEASKSRWTRCSATCRSMVAQKLLMNLKRKGFLYLGLG